jgi:hypothetical protein
MGFHFVLRFSKNEIKNKKIFLGENNIEIYPCLNDELKREVFSVDRIIME